MFLTGGCNRCECLFQLQRRRCLQAHAAVLRKDSRAFWGCHPQQDTVPLANKTRCLVAPAMLSHLTGTPVA
jgi:hypothetical protein